MRLRKHRRYGPARPRSAATDVIRTSGSPHGTIQPNGSSGLSTFTAKPCFETPRRAPAAGVALLAAAAAVFVAGAVTSLRRRSAAAP